MDSNSTLAPSAEKLIFYFLLPIVLVARRIGDGKHKDFQHHCVSYQMLTPQHIVCGFTLSFLTIVLRTSQM